MNTVNMLLTEIALNLLGNTFYNINGQAVDNLATLFKIDENDQSLNPNKRNLKEVLGLESKPKTTVSSSAQDCEVSDDNDDDVVHIEIPEEIITVEDDGETNDNSSPHIARNEIINQLGVNRKSAIKSPVDKSSTTLHTEKTLIPEESRHATSLANDSSSYLSPNASERLDYIKRTVMMELERLAENHDQQKIDYLAANKHLLTILKLNEKELSKRFYVHDKQELNIEIHALMQFLRIIKSNDKANQEAINKASKDILAAKNYFLRK